MTGGSWRQPKWPTAGKPRRMDCRPRGGAGPTPQMPGGGMLPGTPIPYRDERASCDRIAGPSPPRRLIRRAVPSQPQRTVGGGESRPGPDHVRQSAVMVSGSGAIATRREAANLNAGPETAGLLAGSHETAGEGGEAAEAIRRRFGACETRCEVACEVGGAGWLHAIGPIPAPDPGDHLEPDDDDDRLRPPPPGRPGPRPDPDPPRPRPDPASTPASCSRSRRPPGHSASAARPSTN